MTCFKDAFLEDVYSAFPHLDRGVRLNSNDNEERLKEIVDRHGYGSLLHDAGNMRLFLRLITMNIADIPLCPVCNQEMIQNFYKGNTYCSQRCYKADPNAGKKISEIKKKLYADPEWKSKVEEKKTQTTLKNHNVKYPMQSVAIREKHQKNCFQSYNYRGYDNLRGYEKYFVDYMLDVLNYDTNSLWTGSRALVELDIELRDGNSYRFPDFFVPPFTFVEVKSDYTLFKDIEKMTRLYHIVEDMGYDYYLVMITPPDVIEFYSFEGGFVTRSSPFDANGHYNHVPGIN